MLTAYELHCGGVQEMDTPTEYRQLFSRDNMYHVRVFNGSKDTWTRRINWQAFRTYTEAKRFYRGGVSL
jgi:hypothetical protein